MIKIIKHGHAPYRGVCKSCECIFTFDDDDIKNNGGQKDYYEYIPCPDCGKENIINARYKYRNFISDTEKNSKDDFWGWN